MHADRQWQGERQNVDKRKRYFRNLFFTQNAYNLPSNSQTCQDVFQTCCFCLQKGHHFAVHISVSSDATTLGGCDGRKTQNSLASGAERVGHKVQLCHKAGHEHTPLPATLDQLGPVDCVAVTWWGQQRERRMIIIYTEWWIFLSYRCMQQGRQQRKFRSVPWLVGSLVGVVGVWGGWVDGWGVGAHEAWGMRKTCTKQIRNTSTHVLNNISFPKLTSSIIYRQWYKNINYWLKKKKSIQLTLRMMENTQKEISIGCGIIFWTKYKREWKTNEKSLREQPSGHPSPSPEPNLILSDPRGHPLWKRAHKTVCPRRWRGALSGQCELFSTVVLQTLSLWLCSPTTAETLKTSVLAIVMFYRFGGHLAVWLVGYRYPPLSFPPSLISCKRLL